MAASSRYLSTPLRTLRQACREIKEARPGLTANECKACPNRKLCAINERLERRRGTELASSRDAICATPVGWGKIAGWIEGTQQDHQRRPGERRDPYAVLSI